MDEVTSWLLDAYPTEGGLKLWILAALAARQMMAMGVQVRPGMRMQFWFVHGGVKVAGVELKEIDVKRYRRLVELAAGEIIFGK